MKNFLFFPFLFFSTLIFSQNSVDDSKKISQTELVKAMRRIQQAQDKNPDSALAIANSYLPTFKDHNSLAELYLEISTCYYFLGKNNEALSFAQKAKDVSYLGENYNQRVRICGLLANRYRDIGLIPKAKSSLKEGLNDAEKIHDPQESNWVKSLLLTEYSKALTEEKKYDSASIYITKSLDALSHMKTSDKVKFQYTVTYLGAGVNYVFAKQWEKAEAMLEKAIISAKGTEWEQYHISSAQIYLSVIYTNRKEYQKAIDTLISAEKLTEPKDPKRVELYHYLAQNYLAENNLKEYKKYNELYQTARSSLSAENQKAVNKSVQILDSIIKEEADKRKRTYNFLMALGIFTVLSLAGIIFYYQRKKAKQKQLFQNIISKLEQKLKENNSSTFIPKENPLELVIDTTESQKDRTIPEAVEKKILQKLKKFEQSEKFINPNLSLSSLASDLKTNPRYLSEIISQHYGKNFNTYINELRIEYICRNILEDSKYRKYKVGALAEISGFSSAENFSKIFKKITGISPSVFIENATNEDKIHTKDQDQTNN
jgi:AraC-like DNA-binding protein